VPAGFREGLRARLAQVSPQLQPVRPVAPVRPAWRRQVGRWALPAAAAAALALATTGVYGQMGSLLNHAADPQPRESVKTPPVEQASTQLVPVPPPTETEPPTNMDTIPAVPQDSNKDTQPAPPSDPPKMVPNNDPPVNPSQVAEGQSVVPNGPQVASLVEQVTAPQQLPRQVALTTAIEAIVPDPTAACNGLKAIVAGATCATKGAGGHVEVRFTVKVEGAEAAMAQVSSLIGGGVTVKTTELDRAPQIAAAYERVATISEDIQKRAMAVATAKDAEEKKSLEAELTSAQNEGAKLVEDYNRLLEQVHTQLFVIDLQKQGQ
jgi:hypothetical protein